MSSSALEHPTVAALRKEFGATVQHNEVNAGDEHVVYVAADKNLDVLRWLHDDPGQQYNLLRDVTAVDYGGGRPLLVVYQLFSIPLGRSLRLKCELALESLEIASVCPIWATANWLEREVYDLFGITFTGHPDLRRILMPQGYAEGHPLRKDFPLRGRFSRAEQTRRALNLVAEDYYVTEQLDSAGEPQLAPSRLDLEAMTPDSPISSDG